MCIRALNRGGAEGFGMKSIILPDPKGNLSFFLSFISASSLFFSKEFDYLELSGRCEL